MSALCKQDKWYKLELYFQFDRDVPLNDGYHFLRILRSEEPMQFCGVSIVEPLSLRITR